jgi:hypothetical protein
MDWLDNFLDVLAPYKWLIIIAVIVAGWYFMIRG